MASSTIPKHFVQAVPDLAVTANKLAPSSVLTTKLATSSVTPTKCDLTEAWDFSSGSLRCGAPTASTDVATKSYVDNATFNNAFDVANKTANYTVVASDDIIHANPGSSSFITMTLPSAVAVGNGAYFRVKHTGTTNTVIVNTAAGDIDGAASESLVPLESLLFVSDGTNYWIH